MRYFLVGYHGTCHLSLKDHACIQKMMMTGSMFLKQSFLEVELTSDGYSSSHECVYTKK